MGFRVLGMRGRTGFGDIVSHFRSMGGDAVLLNPDAAVGRRHLESAAEHAERAFYESTNRSYSLPTEIILYVAWDRQIGRAMAKTGPDEARGEYAAILIDIDDPRLEDIGMTRDDTLLEATPEKAAALGLDDPFLAPEQQAVERVALLELQKQRGYTSEILVECLAPAEPLKAPPAEWRPVRGGTDRIRTGGVHDEIVTGSGTARRGGGSPWNLHRTERSAGAPPSKEDLGPGEDPRAVSVTGGRTCIRSG